MLFLGFRNHWTQKPLYPNCFRIFPKNHGTQNENHWTQKWPSVNLILNRFYVLICTVFLCFDVPIDFLKQYDVFKMFSSLSIDSKASLSYVQVNSHVIRRKSSSGSTTNVFSTYTVLQIRPHENIISTPVVFGSSGFEIPKILKILYLRQYSNF